MLFMIFFILIWVALLGLTIGSLFSLALVPTIGFGLTFIGASIILSKIIDVELK